MTKTKRISLGADHAGFELKEKVRDYLTKKGYEVTDHGTQTADSVDYPDYAEKVAQDVATQAADFGVLVCGTGLGMAMTANKVPGIRAAPCNDTISARLAREHNDANVLALGGRLVDEVTAQKVLDTWLATAFAAGRHERRVKKIREVEKRNHPEHK